MENKKTYSEIFFKAKQSGDWIEIEKDLLEYENINESFSPGGWRLRMLLHWGAPDKLVKLALKQGADVNFSTKNSPSALHYVNPKRLDIIELLIRNGADVNSKDPQGYTIFMKGHRDLEFYKLVGESGYDFSYIDNYGKNILHHSITSKHWEVELAKYVLEKCKESNLEYLLNERNENGLTPLQTAVTYPLYETIKLFIESGADPSIKIGKNIYDEGEIFYPKGITTFEMILRLKEKYQKEVESGIRHQDFKREREITKIEEYFDSIKK